MPPKAEEVTLAFLFQEKEAPALLAVEEPDNLLGVLKSGHV